MFDRVVMNVVHVPDEISLVADLVLPESFLPNAAFAVLDAGGRDRRGLSANRQPLPRETALDDPPPPLATTNAPSPYQTDADVGVSPP